VLKGAFTIIATPGGRLYVNPTGSPNLATAGTGDVLTGIISSFLAQGLSAENAAIAGTFVHGAAGEQLRVELGDAGTLASDLHDKIPKILKSIMEEV